MIDDVRLTFGALRDAGRPHGDDLAVRALLAGRHDVLLGLDSAGNPHLLIASDEAEPRTSGAAAIVVARHRLEVAGSPATYVDVYCVVDPLAEIFDHLIVAVLDRLERTQDEPSVAVADVIEEWKRLLAAAGAPPGRDRLVAIFGELVVLLDVIRADAAHRMDAWVGPHGGRHDIRRGSIAIEVKTTRAHTARVVTIHGEDQLLEPDGGTLHLHMVRVEEVPGSGRSVPAVVDELIAAGAPPHDVFGAVEAAGLSPADYPMAGEIRFDVRERFTVPIDKDSPRIIASTFVGGQRPAGVVDLTYRLDLDHFGDRALSPAGYEALIATIATLPS